MSVREVAVALEVPKSTVARHWRPNHDCVPPVPTWGTEAAWRAARADVWAHDPSVELRNDGVPYEWTRDEEGRVIEITRKRNAPSVVLPRD